jgi:hypothetical protein
MAEVKIRDCKQGEAVFTAWSYFDSITGAAKVYIGRGTVLIPESAVVLKEDGVASVVASFMRVFLSEDAAREFMANEFRRLGKEYLRVAENLACPAQPYFDTPAPGTTQPEGYACVTCDARQGSAFAMTCQRCEEDND